MDHNNLCPGCFEDISGQSPCPLCGYVPDSSPGAGLYVTPGTLLSGKYLVGRVLGQGGFGITYLGWDTNLDIRIAIKEFFPQGLVSRVPGENSVISYTGEIKDQFSFGVDSFLRESKTLARFEHHPNIVTVRDFFKENNTAYMVMSFIEGLTLLEHLKNSGDKIPVEQAVQIIMPVLDALKEVHRAGIMHRDISPDNIFIDREGRVVIIDFGAARQEMREKSKSLSVILKAGYAPPEQYQSRGRQGPWTDIYAVAATVYRTITGQTPLEAIDRLAEDDLVTPSELGVEIGPGLERALLKALAVKAGERFQTVEEFQKELVTVSDEDLADESTVGAGPNESAELVWAEVKAGEEGLKEKAHAEAAKKPEKKPEPAGRIPQVAPVYSVSKKAIKNAALVLLCILFIFGAVSLFSGGDEASGPAVSETEEAAQTAAPAIVDDSASIYYIDYANGTIPLGDLLIGARVVDPGWEWEFRTGAGYARAEGDQTKPVTWIVVAKDHYEGLDPHVTLLSEELVGRHAFDNSTHVHSWGYNHWGESGTHTSADRGLRPWLNSTGIHSGEGFHQTFSESFKQAVLTTTVPNKEWEYGSAYSTQDKVFIPSSTELGDNEHKRTYRIGTFYPYFQGGGDAKRVALLGGKPFWYWIRSPDSNRGYRVGRIISAGAFTGLAAHQDDGVRPALNLKSGILVSEINP
jgi:serine/threonine protein kinase